jgi:hypothetical protein
MLPSTIETIRKYYPKWELYKKCGEFIGLHPHEINELVDVYRAEVDPYYHFNRSCPECLKEFIVKIFTWHDSHTAAQQEI